MLSYISSFFSLSPSEKDIQKVVTGLEELHTALSLENSFLLSLIEKEKTDEEKLKIMLSDLTARLSMKGITLSAQKIKLILEQSKKNNNEDVAQFMRENKHFKTWDPNAKLTFELSLALITIYCLPHWFLFFPCNMLLIRPLISFITKKLNLGLYTEHLIQTCTLLGGFFYSTPSAIATKGVKDAINQYGASAYLIFPFSILWHEKGTAALATLSDMMAESSGDFLDLMGGVAEPDVAEKYDCLAATTDVFTWLFKGKKATSLTVESTQAPTQACQYRLS